eukprot:TRINITY_DN6508_c0_g1_i9.p1 TRINITY_DN6508_c0_g1~~TRINITY_DN6508_c0_g1_i9.p1  ORF type:complete len:522 (+),score=142.49 TRINITY_DN6508_c0_g1_i9:429-1994(+)
MVAIVFTSANAVINNTRSSLTKTIRELLNLPETSYEQLDNYYLSPIFQDFSLNIFGFDEFYGKACKHIEDSLSIYQALSTDNWIHSEDLKAFLKVLHKLYLHMLLSEPKVELSINTAASQYSEFKRSLHYCLDGFPKEGAACVVVIPSPVREGKVYQGIKESVVMVKLEESSDCVVVEKSRSIVYTLALIGSEPQEENIADCKRSVCEVSAIVDGDTPEQAIVVHETGKLKSMCPVSVRYEDSTEESCHKRNQSLRLPEGSEADLLSDLVQEQPGDQGEEQKARYSLTYSKTARCKKLLPIELRSNPGGSENEVLAKDVDTTLSQEAWEWVKSIRSSKKLYDESCEKKARELKKKLLEMKLQRSKEQLYSESSPRIEHKESNNSIEQLRLLNRKCKRNVPLHSTKLLLQQEKLKSYQEALKVKMSSLKASNGKRLGKNDAREYELYETEAINGNIDALKSSFHLKIQKLNAKLYKYKNEPGNKKESKLDYYGEGPVKSTGAGNIKLKCDRRSAIVNKENHP